MILLGLSASALANPGADALKALEVRGEKAIGDLQGRATTACVTETVTVTVGCQQTPSTTPPAPASSAPPAPSTPPTITSPPHPSTPPSSTPATTHSTLFTGAANKLGYEAAGVFPLMVLGAYLLGFF